MCRLSADRPGMAKKKTEAPAEPTPDELLAEALAKLPGGAEAGDVDEDPEVVEFETVPPFTKFEMGAYNGSLVNVPDEDGKPYATSDTRIIAELDTQTHAIR